MDFDGKAISSALLEYTGDVAARAMRTDFDLLAQIARTLIEAKERGATIYTAWATAAARRPPRTSATTCSRAAASTTARASRPSVSRIPARS